MTQHLLLTIRLHDARYHGNAEWPPAPARVFQALVAGVARGRTLPAAAVRAFEWLERLPPPTIVAPRAVVGERLEIYVPNNDADAVGGDPARIEQIRSSKKVITPHLLDEGVPFLYAWALPDETESIGVVVEAANHVYQLGRGLDMAYAAGEVIGDDELIARLADHRGNLYRPHGPGGADGLLCPTAGSLDSLSRRYLATLTRLRVDGEGRSARMLFVQPPKARFVPIGYAPGRAVLVYELRDRRDPSKLWPWPLARVVALIERVRDGAASRLKDAMPERADAIERMLVGRKVDGRDAGPVEQRVRIVPLPSIGHPHADRAVRRIALEVPRNAPVRAGDVHWALSGLEPYDPETGEIGPLVLTATADHDMLDHYGVSTPARRWRSVTAAALPVEAARRRIEPVQQTEEAKGATERIDEEARAVDAVRTALRHAGMTFGVEDVAVRREPFEARGARAETFAPGTRFAKERMWHVEIELGQAVLGPLLLGDGRFLGLGLLCPVSDPVGLFGFELRGGDGASVAADALVRAMRRAIMSRVQAAIGSRPLGRFFSGHEEDGAPARGAESNHLAIQWDPVCRRLVVIAPHLLDHRECMRNERLNLEVLDRALDELVDLRAGRAGRFTLSRCGAAEMAAYTARSRSWTSLRPYEVTRHPKRGSAVEALTEDVLAECLRQRLPRPVVTVRDSRGVPGRGLQGSLRLDFPVAVAGPLVLGRTRYIGGGLFGPTRQGRSNP